MKESINNQYQWQYQWRNGNINESNNGSIIMAKM